MSVRGAAGEEIDDAVAVDVGQGAGADVGELGLHELRSAESQSAARRGVVVQRAAVVVPGDGEVELAVLVEIEGVANLAAGIGHVGLVPGAARDFRPGVHVGEPSADVAAQRGQPLGLAGQVEVESPVAVDVEQGRAGGLPAGEARVMLAQQGAQAGFLRGVREAVDGGAGRGVRQPATRLPDAGDSGGRRETSTPTAMPMMLSSTAAAPSSLALLAPADNPTPARLTAWADSAADVFPAANSSDALTVVVASTAGTGLAVACWASSIASSAAETVRPRRASRVRKSCRPRSSRILRVPRVQPSCSAASSRVRPARQHSSNGARYFSGRRSSSSSSTRRRSPQVIWSSAGFGRAGGGCRSACRRRSADARSFTDRWYATLYSQPASASRRRMCRALRASTRKVAWNASSASWWLCSTRRQTPRTSGPCRSTRRANAAPSCDATKRSINSASSRLPSAGAAIWRR